MSSEKRSSDLPSASLTRGITLMSVGVAALLVTVKAFAWMASGSVALLASLADSTLDLVASTITFFAVRYAAVPPDDDHRFGHGLAHSGSGAGDGDGGGGATGPGAGLGAMGFWATICSAASSSSSRAVSQSA